MTTSSRSGDLLASRGQARSSGNAPQSANESPRPISSSPLRLLCGHLASSTRTTGMYAPFCTSRCAPTPVPYRAPNSVSFTTLVPKPACGERGVHGIRPPIPANSDSVFALSGSSPATRRTGVDAFDTPGGMLHRTRLSAIHDYGEYLECGVRRSPSVTGCPSAWDVHLVWEQTECLLAMTSAGSTRCTSARTTHPCDSTNVNMT